MKSGRSKIKIIVSLLFSVMLCNQLLSAQQYDSIPEYSKTTVIAYDTQANWKRTGAISTIKGNQLEKTFTNNLGNTLYGRVAGLTVMQGGNEPGFQSPTLYVRGVGTLNVKEILVIVDGFEAAYEQLVPSEIESISVLKDAAAIAMYGSRGANGVLLVTTKRGIQQPLAIEVSTRQGVHQSYRLPKFLNSYDYARLYNEALKNDGLSPALYGYTADALEAYKSGSDSYLYPNVNWYNEVVRNNAPISNYNINFRGGDENIKYFGLLNAIIDNGIVKKIPFSSENSIRSNYKRYNFRANLDINLSKSTTANVTLGGSVEDKSNPYANNLAWFFNKMNLLPPNAFPVYNPDGSYGGTNEFTNPVGDLFEQGIYTSNGRTIQSSIKLTQKLNFLLNGLSASAAISFNNYFINNSNKTRTYDRYAIAPSAGRYTYTRYGQKTSLSASESGEQQWRNIAVQGFLNYNRNFNDDEFNALLMVNSDNYSTYADIHPYKHVGINGRFTYTINKKYITEFTFGYTGSENFAPGKRFGFFPALSLGWIASNENFLKNNSTLSFFKLRGSAGIVGNDLIGGERFMFDQYYRGAGNYYFGTGNTQISAYQQYRIANPDLTWEKDFKFNIGFDMELLKKLNLTFDFFKNSRYDILTTPNNIPALSGLILPYVNNGKVDNTGFELELGYKDNITKDFQYYISTGIWYAKNKIIEMSEDARKYAYEQRTGLPIGQPFGLEAIGFFADDADVKNSPKQMFDITVPGDIKYKDQNNDGLINSNDLVAIGKGNMPELTAGLNVGFKYKSLDLDVVFQGVTGRSVYLNGTRWFALQDSRNIPELALGRWTPETPSTATYPRLSSVSNANNYRFSTFWQKDGSFIKLRSVEIGYSFPRFWSSTLGMDGLRFFINGTNLFTLDHIMHADPEVMSGYPVTRTLSVGLKAKF